MSFVLLARAAFSVSLLCLGCTWCFVSLFLVVSTSAIHCLERLDSKVTCYMSSETLNLCDSGGHCFRSTLKVSVQLIAWKDSSPNDLLCVEWDVKPYTLTHSLTISRFTGEISLAVLSLYCESVDAGS